MTPVEQRRTRNSEDIVSVVAVTTLIVGLLWMILAREKVFRPSSTDPFALPQATASASAS